MSILCAIFFKRTQDVVLVCKMPLAFSKGMLYNINRTVPVTVDYESLTEINV